ncbi:MAG: hypothetical protein K6L76_13600 [Agarilytica sp.]
MIRKFLALITLVPSLSWGAGVTVSQIEFVQVNIDSGLSNVALVKFETPPANSADCATESRMLISLDTEAGKAAFSMALAAKASKSEVRAVGTNSCTNGIESLAYFRFL